MLGHDRPVTRASVKDTTASDVRAGMKIRIKPAVAFGTSMVEVEVVAAYKARERALTLQQEVAKAKSLPKMAEAAEALVEACHAVEFEGRNAVMLEVRRGERTFFRAYAGADKVTVVQ
jgi:hypothetical protein